MLERRPPLTPSDNRNAPAPTPRRPRTKEVTSRYLSTPSPSASYSTSSASTARRFPSPTVTARSAPAPGTQQARRSSSVDRRRPSTTSSSSTSTSGTSGSSSTTTTTTTRSLSVSFQGESFSFSTSRPKPTPGRRSVDNYSRPWPAAVRSLDYSSSGQRSGVEENRTNGEVSCSSDTESVSSGSNSNSGSQEFALPPRAARVSARGIQILPARYLHENHHHGTGRASPRPIRQPSPSKSSNRTMASPIRGRQVSQTNQQQQALNAPSILSFAMEVRRAKKGEYRIEEAHLLRLLDNRELQLRWVNARVNAALCVQTEKSEKKMYNAWRNIGELRDSVALKRMKLQLVKLNLKLASVLKRQVMYLDEWAKMEREHSNSLFGATEALKASTLRLPLVGGAQADVQKLKEVTSSAMDVINAMESSTHYFLPKVFKTSLRVNELARVVSQEHLLLAQSRDLLSTFTALHVKQCSLQGQILQLKSKPSLNPKS
ncbi:hypothetical protein LUZ60_006430 [Juncus effusus]|nr:hypothetical protein LUZ60_006430 [Juncus effusus]